MPFETLQSAPSKQLLLTVHSRHATNQSQLLMHSSNIKNNFLSCQLSSEFLQGSQQLGMVVLVQPCQGSCCRVHLQHLTHKPTPTLQVVPPVPRLCLFSGISHPSCPALLMCHHLPCPALLMCHHPPCPALLMCHHLPCPALLMCHHLPCSALPFPCVTAPRLHRRVCCGEVCCGKGLYVRSKKGRLRNLCNIVTWSAAIAVLSALC